MAIQSHPMISRLMRKISYKHALAPLLVFFAYLANISQVHSIIEHWNKLHILSTKYTNTLDELRTLKRVYYDKQNMSPSSSNSGLEQHLIPIQSNTKAKEDLNADLSQSRKLLDHGKIKESSDTNINWRANSSDNSPAVITDIIPSSSVWCDGDNVNNRNLCFHPKLEEWFILKTNLSILYNVPPDSNGSLLSTISISPHTSFHWDYTEVNPYSPEFRNINVRFEDEPHYFTSRLVADNIMHTLHDNALGIYHLLKHIDRDNFPLRHRLLILDDNLGTPATIPLTYLNNKPLRYYPYLTQDLDTVTCFREATLGSLHLTTWYQYGFRAPQGPLKKSVNGNHIREVADWYIQKVHDTETSSDDLVVILSRKRNRLILNEDYLMKRVSLEYGMHVVVVSNEEHSFEQQINLLKRAKVVMGMHGSLLAMIMFCRRGTVVVELFPFGIPEMNYTPYKTLAELHGMDLVYKSWTNANEKLSFPSKSETFASDFLDKLTDKQRQAIKDTKTVPLHKCCRDPFWIYRIYHDTIVDVDAILSVTSDALLHAKHYIQPYVNNEQHWQETGIQPKPIYEVVCLQSENRPKDALWIQWKTPWNRKVDGYAVVILDTMMTYTSKSTSMAINGLKPGSDVSFRIRSMIGNWKGEYGSILMCTI